MVSAAAAVVEVTRKCRRVAVGLETEVFI
jgi:hypothetical protein